MMDTASQFGGAMGTMAPGAIPGSPILRSLGKSIDELLDAIFTTGGKGGLPRRLRFSNWNADKGELNFHPTKGTDVAHPETSTATYQSTPAQLDELLRTGLMDLEQPAEKAVAATRRKIASQLDRPR